MRSLPYVAALTLLFGVLLALGMVVVAAQNPTQGTITAGGGLIRGNVFGFNMYDEFTPIVWASVTATNGPYNFVAYTGTGGDYEMFVPAGVYNVTVATPGYMAYSMSVAVSDGSSSSINFYLEQSGVPIPEFQPGAFVSVLFIALASVLVAKRATTRSRKRSRQ